MILLQLFLNESSFENLIDFHSKSIFPFLKRQFSSFESKYGADTIFAHLGHIAFRDFSLELIDFIRDKRKEKGVEVEHIIAQNLINASNNLFYSENSSLNFIKNFENIKEIVSEFPLWFDRETLGWLDKRKLLPLMTENILKLYISNSREKRKT